MKTRDEFELAFRRYMELGGHGYDPWDIAAKWLSYKDNPEKFSYLFNNNVENKNV